MCNLIVNDSFSIMSYQMWKLLYILVRRHDRLPYFVHTRKCSETLTSLCIQYCHIILIFDLGELLCLYSTAILFLYLAWLFALYLNLLEVVCLCVHLHRYFYSVMCMMPCLIDYSLLQMSLSYSIYFTVNFTFLERVDIFVRKCVYDSLLFLHLFVITVCRNLCTGTLFSLVYMQNLFLSVWPIVELWGASPKKKPFVENVWSFCSQRELLCCCLIL